MPGHMHLIREIDGSTLELSHLGTGACPAQYMLNSQLYVCIHMRKETAPCFIA